MNTYCHTVSDFKGPISALAEAENDNDIFTSMENVLFSSDDTSPK